ncbi:MAG: glycogen debranching protein GlgX [Campylobacterales bacterium]
MMLKTGRGKALPFGVKRGPTGVNFAIFSKNATRASLSIFDLKKKKLLEEIELDPEINKTGDMWHIEVIGLPKDFGYAYSFDKQDPKKRFDRYNFNNLLLDPYAKMIQDVNRWGEPIAACVYKKSDFPDRLGVFSSEDEFDWEGDKHPKIPIEETIIYELHVRGYTKHKSSKVKDAGTFIGLSQKIPYLKDLGITAVELMPVFEFEEVEGIRVNPKTGEKLLNFWGYNPINFFTPKVSYAKNSTYKGSVNEFRELVKRFHQAGIEVILDVVFNHSAEGNEKGCTYSFRGIDNQVYYMLNNEGEYLNYSGCGNTLNCNHPVVRDMIIDALRYWVSEMHVDGFRFDLASILGRGTHGEVMKNPPLLERIANDPVMADAKLIAEAWDAGGLYQVGTFPSWGKFAEWNGKYRDHIRGFVKSDNGLVYDALQRVLGSNDIYMHSGRGSNHSINFITAHDGFTLNDLVSYNEKHNEENGEENRDGDSHNLSWNCGIEGETKDISILSTRRKQVKNFMTILLLSRGIPMILGGDEFLRTQKGNNNAYCQDSEISWVDWTLLETNKPFYEFVKKLIAFRKLLPFFRPKDRSKKVTIHIHGRELNDIDVGFESHCFAIHMEFAREDIRDYYFGANMYWEEQEFELPRLKVGTWGLAIDTSREDSESFFSKPFLIRGQKITIAPRSIVVLINSDAKI